MNKYKKIFGIGFQNALEYRIDFIIGLFSMFFPIFIQINMWIAIFMNSDKEVIYNYTLPQMICYVILAGLISKVMTTNVEYEIMADIKDGGLNKFIVRPINYLLYRIVENLGSKCAQFFIVYIFITIAIVSSAAIFSMKFSIQMFLLFFAVIFFSVILKLVMAVLISSLSFWLGETWAAFMMLDVIINVMSGGMFPLDIFGENFVNEIRNRAGLPALNPSVVSNQVEFRNAIIRERRVEFAFEGLRWHDLLRWNITKDVMNKHFQHQDEGGGRYSMDGDYRKILAIPFDEISRYNDENVMWQNPGY